MRLQIYMSPELSDKLVKEASEKKILPRKLADQILKEHFGISDGDKDYQTTLNMVINEIDQFLICQKTERTKEYFTLLDFESFRSIGAPSLRAAVGRGIAKYLKERKEIEYLREENGNICRTKNNHAAIYRILHE